MRRLLAAVTTLALTSALALAAPLAANAALPASAVTDPMIGALDYVSFVPGEGLVAVGWAVDTAYPTSTAFVAIRGQYPDGHSGDFAMGYAGFDRPDVAAAVPGAGSKHGFRLTLGFLPPGLYSLCADSWSQSIGCSFATMPTRSITGQFESITLGTGYSGGPALILHGWTADSYQANGQGRSPLSYVVAEPFGFIQTLTGYSHVDRPDIRAAHPSLTGVAGFDDPIEIN